MFKLLSSREKEPLPLQFDIVSEKCRNQFVALFYNVMEDSKVDERAVYDEIRMNLGLKPLSPNTAYLFGNEMEIITKDLDDTQFKDLIDMVCQLFFEISQDVKRFNYLAFVDDINDVLRENGLGYKIQDGMMIRYADKNELERIIEPGFEILASNGFDVPREYLLNAFESYKNKDNSAALVNATKALEATIDKISSLMGVKNDKKANINSKLKSLLDKDLCPRYNESFINALYKLLSEAAARNNEGAHAKTDKVDVDDHIVQYALDQTMASILFLVRSYLSKQ